MSARPRRKPRDEEFDDELEQDEELERELTTVDEEDEEAGYDDESPLIDPDEIGQ